VAAENTKPTVSAEMKSFEVNETFKLKFSAVNIHSDGPRFVTPSQEIRNECGSGKSWKK
jgi:hypothetical protein